MTVAALIARIQTIGMLHYFNLALDNGVTARELSEIITHLAFSPGWSNAFSAVAIATDKIRLRLKALILGTRWKIRLAKRMNGTSLGN